MSDLLAIFGPTDTDSALLTEIERLHPDRVTVLLEGVDDNWALDEGSTASALRDRLAALLTLIERRTGATVTGLAGARDQLIGWRFDREVAARRPIAV
jgi:hypothetical protein